MELMYRIKEIFKSIQGEGPHAGRRALFIRLADCNLSCSFCDTDFTTNIQEMSTDDILDYISMHHSPLPELIVITGGEPMMQEIGTLIAALLKIDREVQIETNGSWPVPQSLQQMIDDDADGCCFLLPIDTVVSPKPGHPVHESVADIATDWKYLIEARGLFGPDGLPITSCRPPEDQSALLREAINIYLQPIDVKDEERNAANMKKAADLCIEHGHRLSIQMHKIVGIE